MLVGDFNFTPDSAAYRLFTTGSVADCDKALFPKPPPYGSEKDLSFLNLSQPLRSAYVLARGREPEFTNYSESAWGGSFSGILDFLFTSDDRIVVTSVDDLPALVDSKPLPNETAPSDHVPVAADVEVVFQP
jgi:endonuclease/exonuclease/phosphatase family metal-dependent hydrolase